MPRLGVPGAQPCQGAAAGAWTACPFEDGAGRRGWGAQGLTPRVFCTSWLVGTWQKCGAHRAVLSPAIQFWATVCHIGCKGR